MGISKLMGNSLCLVLGIVEWLLTDRFGIGGDENWTSFGDALPSGCKSQIVEPRREGDGIVVAQISSPLVLECVKGYEPQDLVGFDDEVLIGAEERLERREKLLIKRATFSGQADHVRIGPST